jgi:hypothetical protein
MLLTTTTLKGLSWAACLLLTGALAWTTWNAIQVKRSAQLSQAEQERVLKDEVRDPEPVKEDIVVYDRVLSAFHKLDWTGKPPPVVAAQNNAGGGPVQPVGVQLRDVLRVLYVQVDGRRPEHSLAYVHYLKDVNRGGRSIKNDGETLRPGDRLAKPYDGFEIVAIDAEGVRFADHGADGAEQRVDVVMFADRVIVDVGSGGERLPPQVSLISDLGAAPPWRPEITQLIGTNRYRIGTESAREFEQNYSQILANEVRYERHRDPRTGKYDGIEVREVAAGSIAAHHGLEAGDVVKSINGTPVTSTSEAIEYVKLNADTTSVWEVVIENKGHERTVIYESPPQE